MAPKKTAEGEDPQAAPDVVFTPAPELEQATAAAPAPDDPQTAPAAAGERYRVRSGGISTPAGAVWHDAIVTADELGDAERVRLLLDRGSIEAV